MTDSASSDSCAAMSASSQSSQPLSQQEAKLLQELSERAKAAGITPDPEAQVHVFMSHGSMSDASKRLREQYEEELLADGYQCVPMSDCKIPEEIYKDASQAPIAPGVQQQIKLPPGVTSLEDWGKTICQLPKVESLGLSYAELVKDAKTHGNYLSWILNHGANRAGKLEDLYLYLRAVQYGRVTSAQVYPGTQEVRQKKVD